MMEFLTQDLAVIHLGTEVLRIEAFAEPLYAAIIVCSGVFQGAGSTFVPLIFPAGDALQIDWGEATVYLDGVKTTVNLFCARLCYSGAPMVLAYRRQNEESFLDALVQVFQYFGGVPKRVIFDNGKVAVKDGFGAHARKQAGYARANTGRCR